MQAKADRQAALLKIVAEGAYRTQEELIAALLAAGVTATQGSVCRDIQELGLSKDEGVWRAPALPPSFLGDAPWSAIAQVTVCGPHLIVVKVTFGAAQAVARSLDAAGLAGVLGTVAGQDTFFVATSGRRTTRRISELLRVRAQSP